MCRVRVPEEVPVTRRVGERKRVEVVVDGVRGVGGEGQFAKGKERGGVDILEMWGSGWGTMGREGSLLWNVGLRFEGWSWRAGGG